MNSWKWNHFKIIKEKLLSNHACSKSNLRRITQETDNLQMMRDRPRNWYLSIRPHSPFSIPSFNKENLEKKEDRFQPEDHRQVFMVEGQRRYLPWPWSALLINLQQVIKWVGTEKAKAIWFTSCDGATAGRFCVCVCVCGVQGNRTDERWNLSLWFVRTDMIFVFVFLIESIIIKKTKHVSLLHYAAAKAYTPFLTYTHTHVHIHITWPLNKVKPLAE